MSLYVCLDAVRCTHAVRCIHAIRCTYAAMTSMNIIRDIFFTTRFAQTFLITESVMVRESEGDPTDNIFVHVRLHPTFEIIYRNSSTPRPRRRITMIDDESESSGDVDMEAFAGRWYERKVGDTYPPSKLPEVQGPFWALDKAVLSQRDCKDVDGSLIPPYEINAKLVESTLVLVQVSLVTYVMVDQKTDKGEPAPNKKVYHILVDKLRILDRADGEASIPPVPTLPERRYNSPATSPQKRGRDEAANAAFENFGAKLSSPTSSPTKRRRNGGGSGH
ncbi:hypothetical protein B0H13DRAFT_2359183 [Mycena leptocephala]|nr:hypothetical protein B0H13DRAFT_2359183 [Mycena leptocephala]